MRFTFILLLVIPFFANASDEITIHIGERSYFIDLDKAVKELMADPLLGESKKGDLAFLRVYKFKMVKQLTLLGYSYEDGTVILELMALGSHENFYREIKKLF